MFQYTSVGNHCTIIVTQTTYPLYYRIHDTTPTDSSQCHEIFGGGCYEPAGALLIPGLTQFKSLGSKMEYSNCSIMVSTPNVVWCSPAVFLDTPDHPALRGVCVQRSPACILQGKIGEF